MSVGIFQLLFIALLIVMLFGRGRIAELMGDFGRGIRSFRQGVSEADPQIPAPMVEVDPAPVDKTTR
jgi:sec-independent protein translocase protein TatA